MPLMQCPHCPKQVRTKRGLTQHTEKNSYFRETKKKQLQSKAEDSKATGGIDHLDGIRKKKPKLGQKDDSHGSNISGQDEITLHKTVLLGINLGDTEEEGTSNLQENPHPKMGCLAYKMREEFMVHVHWKFYTPYSWEFSCIHETPFSNRLGLNQQQPLR